MHQRTLVSLLSAVVCLLGPVTHAFAQNAAPTTERHGFTAGAGLGYGWVSQDLCPPYSCDAGTGFHGQLGWVWRKDLAIFYEGTSVDAGGIGISAWSSRSVDLTVRGASVRYWPRAGRGWLSAGEGYGEFTGGGLLEDDPDITTASGGAVIGAGWEIWRKERQMTLDLGVHVLAVPHREHWVGAGIVTLAFNWYQVKSSP